MGLRQGLRIFKFFPAEALGGPAALEVLSGPFSEVKFLPTGGIERDKVRDYLARTCVLAVGGSWMFPRRILEDGADDDLVASIADCVEVSLQSSD
jgi:2-dehydro-3-deoxyphosphogluconate aldolase/(4S)-4-hydroxy-2-oxoglutarate aldolase